MPRLASQKQRDELKKLVKNARQKEKRMQDKEPDISMEDFGFDERLRYSYQDENLTYSQANEDAKQLKKFNSNRMYGVVGIGSKDEATGKYSTYLNKLTLKEANDKLAGVNEFYSQLNIALFGSQYQSINIYKGEFKKTISKDLENPRIFREMLLNSESAKPYLLVSSTGKPIAGTKYLSSKQIQSLYDIGSYIAIKKDRDLKKTIGRIYERYDEVRMLKMGTAKENYLAGLKVRYGDLLTDEVRNVIEGLTSNEFLYLFYTTEAFTFTFMYDTNSLQARLDAIKTVGEEFIKNKKDNEGYKRFISMMGNLLPTEE